MCLLSGGFECSPAAAKAVAAAVAPTTAPAQTVATAAATAFALAAAHALAAAAATKTTVPAGASASASLPAGASAPAAHHSCGNPLCIPTDWNKHFYQQYSSQHCWTDVWKRKLRFIFQPGSHQKYAVFSVKCHFLG
jgi:hypothetical protein